MVGKKSDGEDIKVHIQDGGEGEFQTMTAPQVMPYIDSMPLSWIKLSECATLIEVLHMCLMVDPKRDTVATFSRIC